MGNALVIEAGQALYGGGDGWQSELARQLGVPARTVRRWISGESEPRPGVYADLLRLVLAKEHTLGDVAVRLRERVEAQQP